jgi:hypothetical protein
MVNKDYILQVAQSNDMRAFKVFDGRLDTVHFSDKPTSPAEKLQELKMFLDNSTGLYKIQLRNKAGLGDHPRQKAFQDAFIGEYEVMLERSEKKGISGMEVASGLPSFEMVRAYESEIRNLHGDKIRLEAELERLKDRLQRMEDSHKEEVSRIKSADQRIAGLLGQFSNVLNPQSLVNKVNGLNGTETESKPTSNDKKARLVKAMNRMIEIDPDFADNLDKLVELAEEKPDMYQMAIQTLKNF